MRTIAVVLTVFCVLFLAVMAYSHCHNNATYENPLTVRGNLVWPPEKKNDDGYYEIKYKVNQDKQGKPQIKDEASYAASHWSDIPWQGRRIKFKYTYDGRASIPHDDVNKKDNINIVAWADLSEIGAVGACSWWYIGNKLYEADMMLNYQLDFTLHANRSQHPTFYCTLDTLTHEFGHGAGLADVYYKPKSNDSEEWCKDYRHYTMNGQGKPGEHFRVNLACEDKYALDQKYR